MTNESTLLLALAGLLHDIGKFMLRASQGGNRIWDDEAKNDFGYKHAMLTASFVDSYIPDAWRIPIKNLAGNHHRPQGRDDAIVSLADILSAAERNDGTDDENPKTVHPRQLLSIFSILCADEKKIDEQGRLYLPLRPLALEQDTLFPAQQLPQQAVWSAYERLWEGFSRQMEQLRQAHNTGGDLTTYLESVRFAMQTHLWSVPSAYYRSLPDISLFEHGRITAALAAVLDREEMGKEQLLTYRESIEKTLEPIALLIGGDISGVQEFLYTITARGATPTLRGRSFYLQMLTEAVTRFVLRRLGLPVTNVIYSGGGNFFLLVRLSDEAKLPAIQQEISRVLLQHHRGDLYLAVAETPLLGQDFFGPAISAKWGEVHEQLRQKKARRFVEMGSELAALFTPLGHGGNEDRLCQVCGQEHPDSEAEEREGTEPVRKCPSCLAFERLGDELRNARFVVLHELPLPKESTPLALERPAGTWMDVLKSLGMDVQVCGEAAQINTALGRRRVVWVLADDDLATIPPTATTAVGRRFLVNVTPVLQPRELAALREDPSLSEVDRQELGRAGDVKPFSILSHQSHGIDRLGILRMDVDNLGELFQKGFEERATLSRIASLSSAISIYFEGWISRVVEEVNRKWGEGDNCIYTIYSGGDDLFFVGAWDAVVELAVRIRTDLTAYAAGHPGIHASAGIALVGSKYPLAQAAQDADDAEKAAKGFVWWDAKDTRQSKDAISFLDEVLPWSRFGMEGECTGSLETAHGLMHTLVDLTRGNSEEKAAPKAFVRNLIELYQQYTVARKQRRNDQADRNWEGQEQVLWGPWTWRASYTLRRLHERTKSAGVLTLEASLRQGDYRMMEWLGVAARWADLYTRRE